nr:MAG TPA: hypothetical protein [Caudoviricetes sp.]
MRQPGCPWMVLYTIWTAESLSRTQRPLCCLRLAKRHIRPK